jgi:hypothetical protein
MPLPQSTGLFLETRTSCGSVDHVIVTQLTRNAATMFTIGDDDTPVTYSTDHLLDYNYTLIDPNVTSVVLLRETYPELFI